jgi:hypothetical protein
LVSGCALGITADEAFCWYRLAIVCLDILPHILRGGRKDHKWKSRPRLYCVAGVVGPMLTAKCNNF